MENSPWLQILFEDSRRQLEQGALSPVPERASRRRQEEPDDYVDDYADLGDDEVVNRRAPRRRRAAVRGDDDDGNPEEGNEDEEKEEAEEEETEEEEADEDDDGPPRSAKRRALAPSSRGRGTKPRHGQRPLAGESDEDDNGEDYGPGHAARAGKLVTKTSRARKRRSAAATPDHDGADDDDAVARADPSEDDASVTRSATASPHPSIHRSDAGTLRIRLHKKALGTPGPGSRLAHDVTPASKTAKSSNAGRTPASGKRRRVVRDAPVEDEEQSENSVRHTDFGGSL